MAQSAFYRGPDTQPGFWQGMADIANAPAEYQRARQEREYRLQQQQLERDRLQADIQDREARRAYEIQNLEMERRRAAASEAFMQQQAASMAAGTTLANARERREAEQQHLANLASGYETLPPDTPLTTAGRTLGTMFGVPSTQAPAPTPSERSAVAAGRAKREREAQDAEENRQVKLAGITERAEAAHAARVAANNKARMEYADKAVARELGFAGQMQGGVLPKDRLDAIWKEAVAAFPDPAPVGAPAGAGGRAYGGGNPPPADDPWGAVLQR